MTENQPIVLETTLQPCCNYFPWIEGSRRFMFRRWTVIQRAQFWCSVLRTKDVVILHTVKSLLYNEDWWNTKTQELTVEDSIPALKCWALGDHALSQNFFWFFRMELFHVKRNILQWFSQGQSSNVVYLSSFLVGWELKRKDSAVFDGEMPAWVSAVVQLESSKKSPNVFYTITIGY